MIRAPHPNSIDQHGRWTRIECRRSREWLGVLFRVGIVAVFGGAVALSIRWLVVAVGDGRVF